MFLEEGSAEHEEKLGELIDKMQQNDLLVWKLEECVIKCDELNNMEICLEYLGNTKQLLNQAMQLIEEADLVLSFCKLNLDLVEVFEK